MLVIYDDDDGRVFIEASCVVVGDEIIKVTFTSFVARSLRLGEGWTQDEAIKAITAQFYDEELGEPCRPTVTLVHIQQPYPKPIQF